MWPSPGSSGESLEVLPLVVVAQTFPARPSSIPEIRDFVRRCLAESPLSEEDSHAVTQRVSEALLDAAGPTGSVQVSFRIFPDHAEVDVLRSRPDADTWPAGFPPPGEPPPASPAPPPGAGGGSPVDHADGASFADWMAAALRREGMTMEAAARQLGVSVKTVSRWVGGTTEPRLRDLRRIREIFGDLPFP